MTRSASAVAAADGNVTRFEFRDGHRRISATVLDDALEAASGLTAPSSAASRRTSFDRFRTLIDAAAKLKLSTLPSGSTGPVVLTRDDLRRVPPQPGLPSYGSPVRSAARSVASAGEKPHG